MAGTQAAQDGEEGRAPADECPEELEAREHGALDGQPCGHRRKECERRQLTDKRDGAIQPHEGLRRTDGGRAALRAGKRDFPLERRFVRGEAG